MPRGIRKVETETEAPVETQAVTIDQATLNYIIDSNKKMQAEIDKLKSKETPILSKERYVGPHQYRYKLYSEVINDAVVNTPILSYRGIKKNPTEELVYGNGQGGYDNNHYVLLTLQGRAEPVKVPIFTFMRCEVSEPTFPKYVIADGERIKGDSKITGREGFANEITGYVFENALGEFTVSPNCIN